MILLVRKGRDTFVAMQTLTCLNATVRHLYQTQRVRPTATTTQSSIRAAAPRYPAHRVRTETQKLVRLLVFGGLCPCAGQLLDDQGALVSILVRVRLFQLRLDTKFSPSQFDHSSNSVHLELLQLRPGHLRVPSLVLHFGRADISQRHTAGLRCVRHTRGSLCTSSQRPRCWPDTILWCWRGRRRQRVFGQRRDRYHSVCVRPVECLVASASLSQLFCQAMISQQIKSRERNKDVNFSSVLVR